MIGTTAESTPDLLNIAFERSTGEGVQIPGAALHAYMASQLVRYALGESAPIRVLSEAQEVSLLLALVLIGAATGLWVRAAWGLACALAVALGALWLLGWAALGAGWWIPVTAPALGWLASAAILTAYLTSRERAERAELMQLFSRHVTKQVAEDVWRRRDEFMEGGRPKPERVTATILFVDIKGYTTVAEKMDPQELMEWIDAYLSVMAQTILDHGGLVDDYFGDGIMACFGIPIPRDDAEGIQEDARNSVHVRAGHGEEARSGSMRNGSSGGSPASESGSESVRGRSLRVVLAATIASSTGWSATWSSRLSESRAWTTQSTISRHSRVGS